MKTFDEMEFHPESEELVELLCNKTQNEDPLFFRVVVAYYLTMISAMMRVNIVTRDRDEIPVSMYAINLAVSGSGKGYSTNLIESQVINQFRSNFTDSTLPGLAQQNLPKIANQRAIRKGSDPDVELTKTEKEYDDIGPLFFSFDSGTAPALKSIRQKLLLANAGSMNLMVDEIGSNLAEVKELLAPMLELYDIGTIKPKLVKSTTDNQRYEEIIGRTPSNMLLFGTPASLLDAGKTEEDFYGLIDAGYARRCFFGYAKNHKKKSGMTARELYDQRTCSNASAFLEALSDKLGRLADMAFVGTALNISEDVELLFTEYEIKCGTSADDFAEHETMRKSEMGHRHFKALKLAGAYAFIEGSPEITEDHAYYAIKLAEESGKAFQNILARDRPYVKLAKYLAALPRSATQPDLVEDLPFYTGTNAKKQEMMQLAIAYGYQNNIIIKRAFNDGIEFISGETLKKTNLDEMLVSYSTDIAKNFLPDTAKFDDLHKLTQKNGMHWCNHHFDKGHRCEDDALPGFNMIVLDIDHEINMSTAKLLLKDYKALFYTTKRHTATENRFRIILPTNYELKLDAKDYKEFMLNLFQWLPFSVDAATGQRARKWLSHNGHYEYQDGELLDILQFIPKTSKNDSFRAKVLDQQGMDNLERWVMNNTGDGNRNNMLLRYAMILVDGGFDFDGILKRVTDLNDKLADKLTEQEIVSTIMTTVSKALSKK
jgi:hypothetical protein